MTARLRTLVLCAVMTTSLAASVLAQGVQTGTVRGVVTAADGAAVANADVIATSPAMQGERKALTDPSGAYVLRGLPPGDYAVRFIVNGSEMVRREARVPLGGVTELNILLRLAALTEGVTVVAPALTTPTTGANYTHAEIDALATPRTLSGIAKLAPGVSDAVATAGPTEGQGQISINGSMAYDNVFLVNGVDVNDNIFAWPQNLFIEDAIAETQVLTAGISAEYGRFGGGVVNAITRSGGNTFSGSYRVNFSNDAWSTETPFEVSRDVTRVSKTNLVHEGTTGGPIVRDRLWFFVAGRYAHTETSPTLPVTGLSYLSTDENERGELKLTATVAAGHTVQGSALGNPRTQKSQANFAGGLNTIDPFALSDKERPNHLLAINYRGAVTPRLLVDTQYSHEQFSTNSGGGTSTALVDSPFLTLDFTEQYNAPYFSASDPDRRNNRQLTGSASYFFGRHEAKAGYEFFRSQKIGGNSPSSTGYVFQADYQTDASGLPVRDAQGRLIPQFAPGDAYVLRFISTPGAELDIDHHSFYVQDHWVLGDRVSADLGMRLERVGSTASGASDGVESFRTVPRLGVAFDLTGTGTYMARATYAHYSGRYNDAIFVSNSAVGNPIEIDGVYTGPVGSGRGFSPGFSLSNYDFDDVFASFPTANVFYDSELSSPLTKEYTYSFAASAGKASAEATYVWRHTDQLIEDFVNVTNGTTEVNQPGVDLILTNKVLANTDLAERDYQALLFQGDYRVLPNVTIAGNWTLQLENDGNYEGEAPNRIVPSAIGDYPEMLSEARHFPSGRLPGFQRHKVHLWGIYRMDLGAAGDATVSGLWRFNSARTYSLRATNQLITLTQVLALFDAGYPDFPLTQTLYYGPRGSESFEGYGVFDTSFSYNVPIFRSLRPWVKADVFNLFNNQTLISWNTSITQDVSTPRDALGLRTGYVQGSQFGRAIGNSSFPVPFAGATGGRTLRLALGIRF